MKFIEFILLTIMLILITISIYLIWLNMPKEPIAFHQAQTAKPVLPISTELQFYPNMRYPDKTIAYSIENSCSEKRQKDMEEAFLLLEQESVLQFTPSTTNPELTITCSQLPPPTEEQSQYFIAGEGGPTSVINSSRYAIILSGSISLFKPEICKHPVIATHELLHALGFDHSSNQESLMYPIAACTQTLDKKIVDEINKIYKEPSLPDLAIQKIEAQKSGRYISFLISIENIGLKDVEQAELYVYAGDKLLKTFELNKTSIGTTKLLEITNLKGPYSFTKLAFRLSSDQQELSLDNNQVELELSS